MNDFDEEKIDRLLCDQSLTMTPYEKVLAEQERRARWKEYQKETIEQKFDWFLKKEMGEFYHYDPKQD